jgi:hypothetical protein
LSLSFPLHSRNGFLSQLRNKGLLYQLKRAQESVNFLLSAAEAEEAAATTAAAAAEARWQ